MSVTPNEEGGPTVVYVNESGEDETCVGFTMPYASVDEVGLDPTGDGPVIDLLPQILEIQAMGGVSMLNAVEGEPTSYDATATDGVAQAALFLIAAGAGLPVAEGATASWVATAPEEPAAAAILCIPDSVEGNDARIAALSTNFGIDPQVVADQINGRIPGGSVEPVSAGSISGGSVATGASLLGSLGGGDATDTDGEEEAEGGSSFTGISEGGSAGSAAEADGEGEVELEALNAG